MSNIKLKKIKMLITDVENNKNFFLVTPIIPIFSLVVELVVGGIEPISMVLEVPYG